MHKILIYKLFFTVFKSNKNILVLNHISIIDLNWKRPHKFWTIFRDSGHCAKYDNHHLIAATISYFFFFRK